LRAVWYDVAGDPASILDRLRRAGLEVAVAIPPHLYYVRETGRVRATLPMGFRFRGEPGPAPDPRVASGRSRSPSASGASDLFFQGTSDALPPLLQPSTTHRMERAATVYGLPFGARWFDTSEFMIGRVAVSILFPESDGSLDPNLYDWTPALRDSVVRSAVRGLARWSSFASTRGVPLTFAIEAHFGLATKYEPIRRTVAEEDNWIQDVLMGYLGYKSDVITLAYDAANRARSRQGAQWAALLIAVQDDSSSTGTFPDGLFSHARLGGPYFVTPVKNAGVALGGATLDSYIEHEMAHIFWALDEHIPSSGWWSCVLTTGYLNVPNSNSVVPTDGYCGSSVHCVMKGNYPDEACLFTQGQIGWWDRDNNGKPDLLESRAAVAPDSDQYRTTAGTPITFRGRALEVALGNQNPYHYFFGDSISEAIVDSVVFSINHGPTQQAFPVDGVFDSGREYFTVTIPPLPVGDYTVEWSAWNSNGAIYYLGKESSFTGSITGTALTVSGSVTGDPLFIGQTLSGTGITNGTRIVSDSGTSWVVSNSMSATGSIAIKGFIPWVLDWTGNASVQVGFSTNGIVFPTIGAAVGSNRLEYNVSRIASVGATFHVASSSGSTITVDSVSSGALFDRMNVSGPGIPPFTVLWFNGTGTGGTGTLADQTRSLKTGNC